MSFEEYLALCSFQLQSRGKVIVVMVGEFLGVGQTLKIVLTLVVLMGDAAYFDAGSARKIAECLLVLVALLSLPKRPPGEFRQISWSGIRKNLIHKRDNNR